MNQQLPTMVPSHPGRLRRIVLVMMAAGVMAGIVGETTGGWAGGWTGGLIGAAHAAPEDGVVRAGSATITGGGVHTRIDQSGNRAVIDWRSFSIGASERVQFVQPSATAAILNRVTGGQVSALSGRLDANGQVFLVNPNGIVIGKGGQVDVGSFIATTSNIANDHFMSGRLVFDQPGKAGAGIVNEGSISAAQGGLVALVAPHVRNDGLIQARLGRVRLGAAESFTIDLYGDQLVNLALSEAHVGQLSNADGLPVQSLIGQAGNIVAGDTVLVTAATARSVLDQLINMSGTIRAETAVQDGGRIVLLGEGGTVKVGGSLDASGLQGGRIDVLGSDLLLASTARLNADGVNGGGTIHAGGAYQGGGVTYRARTTQVDAGALLTANATTAGAGGEVVVWADGHTSFAGTVEAKGGSHSGSGGRLEVSGKGTLDLSGMADASAVRGTNGSLLLDPAYLNIGATEAALINRILRTGTSTSFQADVDININAVIDGRGPLGVSGGGVTLTAGNDININDFVVTHNGAINLTTGQGSINVAAGKAVYAGSAPISVSTGDDLSVGPLLTSGLLSLHSRTGSISFDSFLDRSTTLGLVDAALDIEVNQPIASLAKGQPVSLNAGRDIRVNAQIDGRGGVAGGSLALNAGRDVAINDYMLTNDGAVDIHAGGSIAMSPGSAVFAGNAPIAITGAGDVATNPLLTNGAIAVHSTGGSISFGGAGVNGMSGPVTLVAAGAVDINQPIVNAATNANLHVSAGTDINVNAQIDGRDDNPVLPGGAVTLLAGNHIAINKSIVTGNAALSLSAPHGTITTLSGEGLFAGTGPISLTSSGDITTGGLVTSGAVNLRSTAGSIIMNTPFTDPAMPVGALTFDAALQVDINQPIANTREDASLVITAGTDININAKIDGRDGDSARAGGAVTLTAGQNINLDQSITTENAPLSLTATAGGIVTASDAGLFSGSGALALSAGTTLTTGVLSTSGSLSIASTGGDVNLGTPLGDTINGVTINAAGAVYIDQVIASIRNGSDLTVNAGTDINVSARIEGRGGAGSSGTVNLTAGNNIHVDQHITTQDAVANLVATSGSVLLAPGIQISTGSGGLNVTSGGDFSTGAAPPPIPDPGAPIYDFLENVQYTSNFLKDYVQLVTSGALNISSTHGNVNVDAPIPDTTGPVTISAGNGIAVRQHINSNHQPIVLNAGAGGIAVHEVSDDCGLGSCYSSPAIDARQADLTLNAAGDVGIGDRQVATLQTLTVNTRGALSGSLGLSRVSLDSDFGGVPQKLVLVADGGIPFFGASFPRISQILASSDNGSITISVDRPGQLRLTTGCAECDIFTGRLMGPDVILNAGGSIILERPSNDPQTLAFDLTAGRDVILDGNSILAQPSIHAGRDVLLTGGGPLWILNGSITFTAGRDILVGPNRPVRMPDAASLNWNAGRNVTLHRLISLGPVSISALAGSITLNNPIGPAIEDFDPDPDHKGVASLALSAPDPVNGSITMTGAWAQGDINISTGGALVSSREIVSVLGSVNIDAASISITPDPIGWEDALFLPGPVLPVISPGPLVPPPGAPATASVGAPGLPGFPDIFVAGLPGGSGAGIAAPDTASGSTASIPAGNNEGEAGSDALAAQRAVQQDGESLGDSEAAAIVLADGGDLIFEGGTGARGLASVACPTGVASGSTVRIRGVNGQEQTAICK